MAAIRLLEELSLTALPALQTSYYDGWVLRFAGGYTRRANSINPIYESTLDLNHKIKYCEALYRARSLPVIFKLTPTAYPVDLDQVLARHHYKEEVGASVQVCSLETVRKTEREVRLSATLDEVWLNAYFRLNGTPERYKPVMRQILTQIVPKTGFAALYDSPEKIVAVGLGIIDQTHIGLFDIVTHSEFRKRGLGTDLVSGLLAWGKTNGADQAYLQVRPDNAPALRLYKKLGFRESYQYWYRAKS